MRLEYLFGMSDYRYHLSQGGKLDFAKFIRYHGTEEPLETDLFAIAKMFGAPLVVKNRGIE